jgi:hypothetical protein
MKVKITGFGSYSHDWVAETKDLKITKERDVVTIEGKYGKTVLSLEEFEQSYIVTFRVIKNQIETLTFHLKGEDT